MTDADRYKPGHVLAQEARAASGHRLDEIADEQARRHLADAMYTITVEASAGPESALGASEGFEFAVDLARDELPDRLLAVLALASTDTEEIR